MKKINALLCSALLVTTLVKPGHSQELKGPKQRIAVTAFQDKSNHSFHDWANVGDGMADKLTTALSNTGKFILVERRSLNSAMEEQALTKQGAVQAPTGAKSGQLIGAAYIVTGAVTEFGIKDAKYGVGNLGSLLPIGGGASLQMQTARVALDLRFFDTTTGQVISTEQAVGTKTSRKVESELEKLPSIEFGKEGFDDTIIGQATREAIQKAVALVEKHMENTPLVRPHRQSGRLQHLHQHGRGRRPESGRHLSGDSGGREPDGSGYWGSPWRRAHETGTNPRGGDHGQTPGQSGTLRGNGRKSGRRDQLRPDQIRPIFKAPFAVYVDLTKWP